MGLLLLAILVGGYVLLRKHRLTRDFFGSKPPHIYARNTALFGMAAAVLTAVVALSQETGTGPLWPVVKTIIPPALLFLIPLGFIAWRLRRDPDPAGLAMGIAFPAVVLVMFCFGIRDSWVHGSTEEKMGIFYSFLFFFFSPSWALYLWLIVPMLLRLLYKSLRAVAKLPSGTGPNLALVAAFAALSFGGTQTAWIKLERSDIPQFRVDKTAETLEPMYLCLWRMGSDDPAGRGFPATLEATRLLDGSTARDQKCGRTLDYLKDRPYTLEYERPGKTEFKLTAVEKTRSGKPVHQVWVDQTGVMRQAVKIDGRQDSLKVLNAGSLASLLMAQEMIEEYASKNPRHEYPRRLIHQLTSSDTVPPGALQMKGYRECYDGGGSQYESCVRHWDRRLLLYGPRRDSSGRVTAYALAIPTSMLPTSDPLGTDMGERFRSYLRDESGVIHAYGGNRDATRSDAPPLPDEMARARESFEWSRAGRLEDQRRDSLGKIWWDSLQKVKADSARRDSASRAATAGK